MLTVEISKDSVTNTMPKAWNISLMVKLKEDSVIVLEQTVSEDFKTGNNVSDIRNALQEKAQAVIDKYKSEVAIFNHASLDSLVTDIHNGLVI